MKRHIPTWLIQSASSPSAQGKNAKGSQQRRVSSFICCCFFLRYSSLVRHSKIAHSCCKWSDERVKKKGTSGREKTFQANCGSFWCTVYHHAWCCVWRLCASRNSLLWADVRKLKWMSKMKTWVMEPNIFFKVTRQKPYYFWMHFCHTMFLDLTGRGQSSQILHYIERKYTC